MTLEEKVRLSGSGAYAILRRHGPSSRWERLARTEIHAATNGLLTERTRAALLEARGAAPQHIEASRPGELVCLDTFYIGNLKGVGKVWQLTSHAARRFLRRYLLPLDTSKRNADASASSTDAPNLVTPGPTASSTGTVNTHP